MEAKSAFVTKGHTLTVLAENDRSDAERVARLLQERFKLTPNLNTLRKNLLRCYRQGLVQRKKARHRLHGRRCYVYTLTEKGRGRLQFWTTPRPDARGSKASTQNQIAEAAVTQAILRELDRHAEAGERAEAFSSLALSSAWSSLLSTRGYTQRERRLRRLLEERTQERDVAFWMWQDAEEQLRSAGQMRPKRAPPQLVQHTPRGKPTTLDLTFFKRGLKLGTLERQKLLTTDYAKRQPIAAQSRSDDKHLVDRSLIKRVFERGSASSTQAAAIQDAGVDLECWWQQLPREYKAYGNVRRSA